MDDESRTCALCGDPIQPGEAQMTDDTGRLAHSGCVYRDETVEGRDRWMPPEA